MDAHIQDGLLNQAVTDALRIESEQEMLESLEDSLKSQDKDFLHKKWLRRIRSQSRDSAYNEPRQSSQESLDSLSTDQCVSSKWLRITGSHEVEEEPFDNSNCTKLGDNPDARYSGHNVPAKGKDPRGKSNHLVTNRTQGAFIVAGMFAMTFVCASLIDIVQSSSFYDVSGPDMILNSVKRAALIHAALIVLVPVLRYGEIGSLEQAATRSEEAFLFALVFVFIKCAAVIVTRSSLIYLICAGVLSIVGGIAWYTGLLASAGNSRCAMIVFVIGLAIGQMLLTFS